MRFHHASLKLISLFVFALILNISVWIYARDIKPQWPNIPPAPSAALAKSFALGDPQFAYRVFGITLQNMGDTGGRTTRFEEYDYARLEEWFFMMDELDPRANFVPILAAYYYSNTTKTEDLIHIVRYLSKVGTYDGPQKWRWLAQAVYIARFKMQDKEWALRLANQLAGKYEPGMPAWVLQMPAFVQADAGDKQAAYSLLLNIIKSEGENLDPAEVNFMRYYICDRILNEDERSKHPLCEPGTY